MTKEEAKKNMQNAERKYNSAKNKIKEYELYIERLDSLNSSTLKLIINLNETTSAFFDGGYNDGGETFDRGVLKSTASGLTNISSDINDIISKTKLRIEELNLKKTQSYNEWQNAISIYNSL